MSKNHLKTMSAPATWKLQRKSKTYILKPNPGAHKHKNSVSANYVLIDLLGISHTKKESKYIINTKELLVNGKKVNDVALPIGIFDPISVEYLKKYYRVVIDNQGKLKIAEIDKKESEFKVSKITGKSLLKNKIQLHLYDGVNILTDNKEYKVGDSVMINLKDKKITKHFPLKKNSTIILIGGKHPANTGKVEDILEAKIIYKASGKLFETLKKYAFVVGEDKSAITIK